MANKELTAVDQWVNQQAPVNGDNDDGVFDEAAHQTTADRTQYLYNRGVISNFSEGSAAGTWDSTTYGSAYTSTSWGQIAVLGKSLSGLELKAGTIVIVIATIRGACADASDIAHLRITRADNGGAAAMLGGSGAIIAGTSKQSVTLVATCAIAADLTSCDINVEAKVLDASDSLQLYEPTDVEVICLRKFQ